LGAYPTFQLQFNLRSPEKPRANANGPLLKAGRWIAMRCYNVMSGASTPDSLFRTIGDISAA
jgi:hypothetical protein